MLSKLGSHARHNLVAYLALFVAFGGTAVAAHTDAVPRGRDPYERRARLIAGWRRAERLA